MVPVNGVPSSAASFSRSGRVVIFAVMKNVPAGVALRLPGIGFVSRRTSSPAARSRLTARKESFIRVSRK